MVTKAQLLSGGILTGDYRPTIVGAHFFRRDHRGYISPHELEEMRRDPRIRLALRTIKAPIAVVEREIVAEDPNVEAWLKRTYEILWQRELSRWLVMIDYGRSGGEAVWRLDEQTGLVELKGLRHIYPLDMQAMEADGDFWGIRIKSIRQDIPVGRCFYLVNDADINPYYGRSRLIGAWEPWQEKTARHGARDIRRGWFVRNVYRGGRIRYPAGSVQTDDGRVVSNQDFAREIVEKAETGGVIAMPVTKDPETGEFLWIIEDPQVNGDIAGVREYVKDLDVEILEGMEIPPEVIEAQQTGSWAGRSVPFLVFLTGEDLIADNALRAFETQVVRPAAEANFGKNVKYTIKCKSLVPKDEGQGGKPQGQGGMGGQEQPPPGPDGGGGEDDQPGGSPGGILLSMEREELAHGDADPWEAYVGKRGIRKGVAGWKNRITKRIAWGEKPRRFHAPKNKPELATMKDRAKQVVAHREGGTLTPDHVRDFVEEVLHMSAKDMRKLASELGSGTGHHKAELTRRIQELVEGKRQGKSEEARKKQASPMQRKAKEAEPWKGETPDMGKVYNAPTSELHVDPSRFQFKLNVDASGVTDELKSVKSFNPDFAGVISVWKDPSDGKTYVINGHHRHHLAKRTGHPNLAVRYIEAKSPKEARAVGALINIAEGRGTAVDAAKFMRDMGVSVADMETRGISLKGKVAADAVTMTRLNDRLFDRVARGVLDESKALSVARHLPDHDLQDTLFRLLDKREEEGKDLSPRVIEEMAREMAETPKTTKTESSLFGDIESEESLFVERNEVKAYVRTELTKEISDFLAVSSKRRAARVAAAGNVLDPEENKKIAEEAGRVRNTFDTLVNRKGDISDKINEAAADYAKAKGKKAKDEIKQRTVESVKQAVFKEAGVGQTDGGGEGGGVPASAATPAPEPTATPTAAPARADEPGRGDPAASGLEEVATSEPSPAPAPTDGREKAVGKLVKSIVGTQAMTQARAKAGGEIGPNGEHYPGGAFIATQDLPKRLKDKLDRAAKGKVQVDGGKWAVPEPGQMSILNKLGGTVLNARNGEVNYKYLEFQKYPPEEVKMFEEIAEKWRSGERWISVNDYPAVANLDDLARLVVAGQAVPGDALSRMPQEWQGHLKKYAPKGASPTPSTPPEKPEPSDHHSQLSAIGVGDMARVGGVMVRRTGPDDYRVEVDAGKQVSAANQSADERRAGVVRGSAADIAKHIESVAKQDKMYGRQRESALSRAESYAEPSFMDREGIERARKGFEALPEGTPVVSLEDETKGRVGHIKLDENGRKRVRFEGEDGWASSFVEPLDEKLSWRVERKPEQGPKQASIFDQPVTPDAHESVAEPPAPTPSILDQHGVTRDNEYLMLPNKGKGSYSAMISIAPQLGAKYTGSHWKVPVAKQSQLEQYLSGSLKPQEHSEAEKLGHKPTGTPPLRLTKRIGMMSKMDAQKAGEKIAVGNVVEEGGKRYVIVKASPPVYTSRDNASTGDGPHDTAGWNQDYVKVEISPLAERGGS